MASRLQTGIRPSGNTNYDLTVFYRVIVPIAILVNVVLGLFMLFTLPDETIGLTMNMSPFKNVQFPELKAS